MSDDNSKTSTSPSLTRRHSFESSSLSFTKTSSTTSTPSTTSKCLTGIRTSNLRSRGTSSNRTTLGRSIRGNSRVEHTTAEESKKNVINHPLSTATLPLYLSVGIKSGSCPSRTSATKRSTTTPLNSKASTIETNGTSTFTNPSTTSNYPFHTSFQQISTSPSHINDYQPQMQPQPYPSTYSYGGYGINPYGQVENGMTQQQHSTQLFYPEYYNAQSYGPTYYPQPQVPDYQHARYPSSSNHSQDYSNATSPLSGPSTPPHPYSNSQQLQQPTYPHPQQPYIYNYVDQNHTPYIVQSPMNGETSPLTALGYGIGTSPMMEFKYTLPSSNGSSPLPPHPHYHINNIPSPSGSNEVDYNVTTSNTPTPGGSTNTTTNNQNNSNNHQQQWIRDNTPIPVNGSIQAYMNHNYYPNLHYSYQPHPHPHGQGSNALGMSMGIGMPGMGMSLPPSMHGMGSLGNGTYDMESVNCAQGRSGYEDSEEELFSRKNRRLQQVGGSSILQKLENGEVIRRSGTTKFFDLAKGYGFISDSNIAELGGKDIFVHYTAILMKSGFRCLATNEAVEYDTIKASGGGYQALNVSGAKGVALKGLTEAQFPEAAAAAEGRGRELELAVEEERRRNEAREGVDELGNTTIDSYSSGGDSLNSDSPTTSTSTSDINTTSSILPIQINVKVVEVVAKEEVGFQATTKESFRLSPGSDCYFPKENESEGEGEEAE